MICGAGTEGYLAHNGEVVPWRLRRELRFEAGELLRDDGSNAVVSVLIRSGMWAVERDGKVFIFGTEDVRDADSM